MSINANYLVSLPPRTITGGSSDLQTNGMVLTTSALIPADKPAMSFVSASAVAAVFGAESAEAVFAQQYFTGLVNQQKTPDALIIGRLVSEDSAAWVRSAPISAKLAELKKVTDGAITFEVNGKEVKATGISFAAATSLSEVASLIAAKVTGTAGAYNSDLGEITLTTTTKGENATLSFGAAPASGTDLAALLGFTEDAGAVLSQGSKALSISANLDKICNVTRNWTQFTTLEEVTDEETAQAFAAWAVGEYDDYVYVFWSSDDKMTNQLTIDATIAKTLSSYSTTFALYCKTNAAAATVIAYPATIKWDANQGMKVLFGKQVTGVPAIVTDETIASTLDDLKVSYIGEFATRNATFTIFNRGAMMGSKYGFYDAAIGMIWLRAKIQRACMDGFSSVNRVPYNEKGYALIDAWISDPIREAKKVGVIDEGVSLSDSQKAQITQEVGEDISDTLYSNGYWFGIEDPASNVRAERGSPSVSLYFTYAGSVQKLEMPVTAVL